MPPDTRRRYLEELRTGELTVLCNVDVPLAEETLLPPPVSRAAGLRNAASSNSVVSLSFALDAQFPEALAHHTIVFAEDLSPAPWEALFGARRPSSFLPVAAAPRWSPGRFYVSQSEARSPDQPRKRLICH